MNATVFYSRITGILLLIITGSVHLLAQIDLTPTAPLQSSHQLGLTITAAYVQSMDEGASPLRYSGLLFPVAIQYRYSGAVLDHNVAISIASSGINGQRFRSPLTQRGINFFKEPSESHVVDAFLLHGEYGVTGRIGSLWSDYTSLYLLGSIQFEYFERMYTYSYRSDSEPFGSNYDERVWDVHLPLIVGLEGRYPIGSLDMSGGVRTSVVALTSRPPYALSNTNTVENNSRISKIFQETRVSTVNSFQLLQANLTAQYPVANQWSIEAMYQFIYYHHSRDYNSSTLSNGLQISLLWRL
jgi:hypothetical protein